MSKTNIFLLLPETNPTSIWSNSNEHIQTEDSYNGFVKNKVSEINLMKLENFVGYYSSNNLKNFFKHFDTLEEYYPKVKRKLISKIKDWENWQNEPHQKNNRIYKIFNQLIKNHTLPEIAERKNNIPNETFVLLNNNALTIQDTKIIISISDRINIEIDNLKNASELKAWFAKYRTPNRKFHLIPKHGENGTANWKEASPLMCSKQNAQVLLNTAIGISTDKLYNYDSDNKMYIIFWNENEPQNKYHGYHLPLNTIEIPHKIKKIIYTS